MTISRNPSPERTFLNPNTLDQPASTPMESQPRNNGQTTLTSYSRFMHQHTQRQISALPNLGDRLQEAKSIGCTGTSSSSDGASSGTGTHDNNDGQRYQRGGDH